MTKQFTLLGQHVTGQIISQNEQELLVQLTTAIMVNSQEIARVVINAQFAPYVFGERTYQEKR